MKENLFQAVQPIELKRDVLLLGVLQGHDGIVKQDDVPPDSLSFEQNGHALLPYKHAVSDGKDGGVQNELLQRIHLVTVIGLRQPAVQVGGDGNHILVKLFQVGSPGICFWRGCKQPFNLWEKKEKKKAQSEK